MCLLPVEAGRAGLKGASAHPWVDGQPVLNLQAGCEEGGGTRGHAAFLRQFGPPFDVVVWVVFALKGSVDFLRSGKSGVPHSFCAGFLLLVCLSSREGKCRGTKLAEVISPQ